MKRLKFSATITAILGSLSVLAVISLFLALHDIANHETDQTLEWFVVRICIIVLFTFTISTFVTLAFLHKSPNHFHDHSLNT
ncbi:MAG: hypothetical protein IPJ37_02555 [Bacteroidales bacterium]|nr:hypothetical protein [Bacteroidales bacterium]